MSLGAGRTLDASALEKRSAFYAGVGLSALLRFFIDANTELTTSYGQREEAQLAGRFPAPGRWRRQCSRYSLARRAPRPSRIG